MKQYTVFCKSEDSDGTTWIGSVKAKSDDEAIRKGREQSAADWDYPEDVTPPPCIGLAKGNVQILQWDDEQSL
jgi:hypothetical protein